MSRYNPSLTQVPSVRPDISAGGATGPRVPGRIFPDHTNAPASGSSFLEFSIAAFFVSKVLCNALSFAKMPSVFIFIAFQNARVGGSERLLTVKKSGTLFDSSAGWSFGEGQVQPTSSFPLFIPQARASVLSLLSCLVRPAQPA